jgi:hypothetical protein
VSEEPPAAGPEPPSRPPVPAAGSRRIGPFATLVAPGAACLALDLLRRPERVLAFDAAHAIGYAVTTFLAGLLWAALLAAAAMRGSRFRGAAAGVFVTLFGLAAGVQHAFFARYNVYASFDTAFWSDSFPLVLVASFPRGVTGTLLPVAVAAIAAIALVRAARVVLRLPDELRRTLPFSAGLMLVVLFLIPVSYRVSIQSSAPEAIYLHSLSSYVGERLRAARAPADPTLVRVQLRSPAPLPRLEPAPAAPRNVLFLLHESQRADSICSAFTPDCRLPAAATNPLLPARYPFLQMRAAASSTAVAVSNLWAGVDPIGSHAALHAAPLLWEYAAAAGLDTAYWTSQNLMFGNARLYVQDLPLAHFVSATHLDPGADTLTGASDDLLTDHVIARWSELREPFFAVAHYSNLHRPRRVDPAFSPYQPASDAVADSLEGKNHYKNAVHLSDRAVARLIAHVRASPSGRRTVIVYTSDHGESLAEHDNEIEHSSTVYDEEIHVPAWIDAPDGTLSQRERTSLAAKRDTYLVQYDLAATLLDLMGLWDTPALAPFRDRILGAPLSRPETYDRPVPLTNVSWVWEYRYPNWGMIQGPMKVLALPGDDHYRCHDLESDPAERDDLGEAACADLVRAARERFRILPRDMPSHIRSRPDIWGPWPPRR